MADWPYNTAAWRNLRTAKLAVDPLCHACRLRGLFVPAQAVDHVTPISQGGDPFPAFDGLMSLCIRCHNEKTSSRDRKGAKPFARRFKGFGPDGNPIDPGDEWHRGGVRDEDRRGPGPLGESGTYLVSKSEGPKNGA